MKKLEREILPAEQQTDNRSRNITPTNEPLEEISALENSDEQKKLLSREVALKELQEQGFFEYVDGVIIFDTEKFLQNSNKIFFRQGKLGSFCNTYGERRVAPTTYELFKDFQVISKNDFNQGIREPKNLLYNPKDSIEALDIESIKKSEFYLDLSLFYKHSPFSKRTYGNIADLDYREVVLPLFIYHPNYGDGYRDAKTGKLFVRNKQRKYQKFSTEWVIDSFGILGNATSKNNIQNGRFFLRKETPHLLEHKLLQLTDVQSKQYQGAKTEINHKLIGLRGQVMFDDIRYTIGSAYENNTAYKLNSVQGVVVGSIENNSKAILATFDIVPEEHARVTKGGYKLAGINKTNPQSFDWSSFRKKRDSETIEEYKKRIEDMENFEHILQSEKYLRDELGIALERFSFNEQSMIARMLSGVSILRKETIDTFITKFGDNGLKTFLSLESDRKMGDKIISIGERFDQETASAIFAKYAELADFAQSSAEYLSSQFKTQDPKISQQVAEHLLRRGKALLIMAADDESISSNDILKKLESINAETELLKDSFKTLRSKGEPFSLEEIKATQFKLLNGQELSAEKETVSRMKEIYLENYSSFPDEFKQKIIAGLEQRLANTKTEFYVLYHQKELVAFCSMLEQENGATHFANFNVSSKYASSKIGEAMMEASIDKTAKKYAIVAEAVPGLPITDKYLDEKSFQKIGEIEVAGVKLWQIKREKDFS